MKGRMESGKKQSRVETQETLQKQRGYLAQEKAGTRGGEGKMAPQEMSCQCESHKVSRAQSNRSADGKRWFVFPLSLFEMENRNAIFSSAELDAFCAVGGLDAGNLVLG